jgi:hypothetical protein
MVYDSVAVAFCANCHTAGGTRSDSSIVALLRAVACGGNSATDSNRGNSGSNSRRIGCSQAAAVFSA